MIVDFEQDPQQPFGIGNFRDEAGRYTYADDPETARQFVKTMKGPDMRTAQAAPGQAATAGINATNDAVADLEKSVADYSTPTPGVAPEPAPQPPPTPAPAPAPGTPGAAATAGIDQTNAAVAGLEAAVNAPPAPGAPPPAPGVAPAAAPAPGAPPAPAGAGAALVETLGQHDVAIKGPVGFRTTPRDIPAPTPRPTNGLPPASTTDGETVSVEEGRPLENVVEQISDEQTAGEAGDQVIRDTFGRRMAASEQSFRTRQGITQAEYGSNVRKVFEARAERQAAEAEQARLQKALEENDKSLDPDRVMRDMSTGKMIGMVILAALNGGFGAVIGKKDNDVLNVMDQMVERDIDRQKQEIASGRVRLGNLIDKFMKEGFDAKTAEMLARDKLDGALAAFKDLEAQRVGASAELKGQMDVTLQQRLEARTQRRGELLATAENKVGRAMRAEQVHAMPPVIPGVTGALGAPTNPNVPRIAPVGTEDESAEVRAQYANNYNPADPGERGQMAVLSSEMKTVSALEQTLEKLEKTYGVRPDKNGNYPKQGASKAGGGAVDYSSKATGPAWNPLDALPNDPRDRALVDGWAEVESNTRQGWVAEPNGTAKQTELSGIDRPKRDDETPQKLADLRRDIERRKLAAQSAPNVTVRAAWKLQNGYPVRTRTVPASPGRSGGAPPPAAGGNLGKSGLPKTLDGQPKGSPPPAAAPAAPPPPPPPAAPPQRNENRPRGGVRFE